MGLTLIKPKKKLPMKKTMKTDEAIALIKQDVSVEDIVSSDLEEKRLSFRDALLLVENGFLVSKENILFKDEDIAN